MGPGFLQGDMSGKQLVHWHSPPWNCRLGLGSFTSTVYGRVLWI